MPRTTKQPSRRRRILSIFGASLLVAAILALVWHLWSTRGYRQAEGIYLADGGQSFIEIRAGFFGRLRVVDGYIVATSSPCRREPTVVAEAHFRSGKLTIEQEEVFEDSSPGVFKGTLWLRLARGTSGDWDAEEASDTLTAHLPVGEMWKQIWHDFTEGEFEALGKKAKGFYKYIIKGEPFQRYALDKSAPPLRAFLHRVDDQRLSKYFGERRRWENPQACLNLIRAICADHPDDRFLMLHLGELEAVAGDIDTAQDVRKRWEKRYRTDAGPLLSAVADRAWQTIWRARFEEKHPLLPYHSELFPQSDDDPLPPVSPPYDRTLDGHMRFFRDRCKAEGIHFSENPVVRTSERIRIGARLERATNFGKAQVATGTARTIATLALLQGERPKALELLLGAYRLGQDVNAQEEILITALVGIGLRRQSARRLALYALNACDTEQELAAFTETLDRLTAEPGQPRADRAMLGDLFVLQNLLTDRSGKYLEPYLEDGAGAAIRHQTADATMAALRAAAHARLQFLRTGKLPESTRELTDLFPDGPPLDPFTSNTLSIQCVATSRGCTVYSVGPDRIDQKAAIEYTPGNGVISEGDITLAVPREREYPFPREGLRAASARDVIRVFSNGLPYDHFSYYFGDYKPDPNYGDRLAILDATSSTAVVIFSVGPDGDEIGPTSPTLWNFPIPSRQPVYRRAFSEPARPGYYVLQPLYDPTNGTTSAGDLFVEIPRP